MTLQEAGALGPWEGRARAIGEGWLNWDGRDDYRPPGVDALVAEALAAGEPRLGALSQAWEAVVLSRRAETAAKLRRIHEIVDALRAQGWPRATWLAESALALCLGRSATGGRHAEALGWLDCHDAPAAEGAAAIWRPAMERAWSCYARCILKALVGRFDDALRSGLEAEHLAEEADNDRLRAMAAHALSYVFLAVGDLEGALNALPRCIEAYRRTGMNPSASFYNLMLALLLDRRPREALAVAQAEGWLFDASTNDRWASACSVRAASHAAVGELDAARRWLAHSQDDDEGDHVQVAVLANRAWLAGAVRVALGESAKARADIEALLARSASASLPLSPMNGTQLMRVLGDACEALGDLPGSLAAFKRSQAYCFNWVAESMRARLQALHLAAAEQELPGGDSRQQARLHALDAALDDVRADGSRAVSLAGAPAPVPVVTATATATVSNADPQRQFVAQVSHEMRNPLNGLIGMTSLLMLSELDEQQRRYVQLAQTSAQMLMALCNDILDLAKMDAGRFELHPADLDPSQLVREVVQTFEPLAQTRRLVLRCLLDTALPTRLLADPLRVRQVLMNLVSNAIKFTGAGSVEVDARWRPGPDATGPGSLVLAVRDTGPGLDAQERAQLFQEFVQVGAAASQRAGGTGLGLVLCRRLVALMGGSIEVESAKGEGSTFRVVLPLQRGGDGALAA